MPADLELLRRRHRHRIAEPGRSVRELLLQSHSLASILLTCGMDTRNETKPMVNTSVMRTAEDHSHHSRRSTFPELETPGARTEEMSAFGSADAINKVDSHKPRGTTGDTPPLAAKPHTETTNTMQAACQWFFLADATYFLQLARGSRDAFAQFQPTDKQSRFATQGVDKRADWKTGWTANWTMGLTLVPLS